MFKKIFVIAKNTFKETIRDRILYGILIFSVVFILSTVILGSLSLGEDAFVIKNFGLAGIYFFSLIITIFLGATLVYKEIEKKTIYFVLSKPVTTFNIILGKFIGLLASVALITLIMTVVYSGITVYNGATFDFLVFLPVLLQLCEMAILIAILIMLSIFLNPLAATIYTVLVVYAGHLSSLFLEYAQKSSGIIKFGLKTAYYIFPNLEKFNIRNMVAHSIKISGGEIVTSIIYACVYTALVLYLAEMFFRRREL